MTGHCDADVLAEYRDGLLGRRRSARIRAHLTGCARCSALSAGLAEVSALLASVPPPAMPGELITRLDGVLAAESAARAEAQGAGAAEDAGTVTPADDGNVGRAAPARAPRLSGRRRPGRTTGSTGPGRVWRSGSARPGRVRNTSALRAASVAAAVLVVAGGGYGVARLVQGSSGTGSGQSGAAAGPAHPALGRMQPNSQSGAVPAIRVPAPAVPVVHSGTDYLPGQLTAQAQAVLGRYPAGRAVLGPAGGDTTGPQGCARLVAGSARLRLIDVARWRGQPAIVIMTAAAAGRPGQIWVTGPGCPAAGRDVIEHAQLTGAG